MNRSVFVRTAALAVAIDAASPFIDVPARACGMAQPGGSITLYVAPASSYAGNDPAAAARAKAEGALVRGFDALRAETAAWWQAFFSQSAVVLPDADLATWYARSIWYLGVFFGNTDVPPGCNGTSLESFAGGTLGYKGKSYPFSIDGLDVGSVGMSTSTTNGKVYNLKNLQDFNGTYTAIGASATVGGGGSVSTMRNQNGVKMTLGGTSTGLRVKAGVDGLKVQLKE